MANDSLNLGNDDADESAGGKGKLIIIIAVVLLLGGGAAAFFLLSGGDEEAEAGAEAAAAVELPKEPLYVNVKKLLVNLDHAGRTHYIQAEMQLMTYSQEVADQASRDMPAIRDRLLILFNSQDFAALKSVEGKEALRAAALTTVNEALGLSEPAMIEEIYFENFVLQ